eukprot:1139261-Pelagomonas_calceolata.AAC.3
MLSQAQGAQGAGIACQQGQGACEQVCGKACLCMQGMLVARHAYAHMHTVDIYAHIVERKAQVSQAMTAAYLKLRECLRPCQSDHKSKGVLNDTKAHSRRSASSVAPPKCICPVLLVVVSVPDMYGSNGDTNASKRNGNQRPQITLLASGHPKRPTAQPWDHSSFSHLGIHGTPHVYRARVLHVNKRHERKRSYIDLVCTA